MMMLFRLMALVIFLAATGPMAFAQEEAPAPAPDLAPAPADMIPADTASAAPQTPSNFPQLPPSRPCVQDDLYGIWKLMQVYEEPAGSELAQFSTNPVQYMLFLRNSTFGKYNSGTTELDPKAIRQQMLKGETGVQQYIVHDSGIVFFYRDRVAVDSLACFIVANRSGNFLVGQMLMMPPAGQITGRLVKVYKRISVPAAAAAAPPPRAKAAARNTGKNNNRRQQQPRHR